MSPEPHGAGVRARRILVAGCGAIGSMVGCLLRQAGHDVGVAEANGLELPWPSAEEYRKHFYTELLPPTYEHRSSMLQDLERGRRTEIGALNGKIWQYGEEVGVSTPANQLLTRLVAGLEKRGHS